jgi:hypothetical protein
MSATPSIPDTVRELRLYEPRARTLHLQSLIGPKTTDVYLLHWRALLLTALNEAGVWPPRMELGERP